MKKTSPFVITISRQLGSGGAYIGQQLAKNLNVLYLDREIICQAAKQFSMLEEDLEARDEKVKSFWESLLQPFTLCDPDSYLLQLFTLYDQDNYVPPQIFQPTDHELFKAEAEIIKRIARERPAVIIGRCGSYILREHPKHISVFLYGDIAFRKNRVQEVYNVSMETAEKMIIQSDSDRYRYHYKHTKKKWTDARNYDISIDTSKIGVDKSTDFILNYLELIEEKM